MEKNNTVLRYSTNDEMLSEVIAVAECSDAAACTVMDVRPEAQGRMIEIGVRVRGICPGKRTVLGIVLYELDACDAQFVRGMKSMTLPAHHETGCRDVIVEGLRFVLPEDVSMSEDSCGERRFRVRVIAHYMDVADACGYTDS